MKSSWLASTFALYCLSIALTGGSPLRAEESREIWDRVKLRAGVLLAGTSTELAAGDVLGTLVNIEEVLGYDKNETIFGISGFYRSRSSPTSGKPAARRRRPPPTSPCCGRSRHSASPFACDR